MAGVNDRTDDDLRTDKSFFQFFLHSIFVLCQSDATRNKMTHTFDDDRIRGREWTSERDKDRRCDQIRVKMAGVKCVAQEFRKVFQLNRYLKTQKRWQNASQSHTKRRWNIHLHTCKTEAHMRALRMCDLTWVGRLMANGTTRDKDERFAFRTLFFFFFLLCFNSNFISFLFSLYRKAVFFSLNSIARHNRLPFDHIRMRHTDDNDDDERSTWLRVVVTSTSLLLFAFSSLISFHSVSLPSSPLSSSSSLYFFRFVFGFLVVLFFFSSHFVCRRACTHVHRHPCVPEHTFETFTHNTNTQMAFNMISILEVAQNAILTTPPTTW